ERDLADHRKESREDGDKLSQHARTGQPIAGLLATNGLVWAKAEVIYDSPDKADVESGDAPGLLLRKRLIAAAKDTHKELVVVSPYFVPGAPGEQMLKSLRERGV